MITPHFSLTQDDVHLTIRIRAPYANIADTEIEYDEREFLFTSRPYFLRLYLPAAVIDNDTGTADYDAEKGAMRR